MAPNTTDQNTPPNTRAEDGTHPPTSPRLSRESSSTSSRLSTLNDPQDPESIRGEANRQHNRDTEKGDLAIEKVTSREPRRWTSKTATAATAGPSSTDTDDDDAEELQEDDTALGRLASTTAPIPLKANRTRTRSRSRNELPPPPDGGLRAWSQVVAGWLAVFATWGYINSFGAFQSYYTSEALSHLSPSTISWIGAVQISVNHAVSAISGRMVDAGYFYSVYITGTVLQVAGTFTMSASATDPDNPTYWHLMLTQGLLTGLGGILFTPTMAVVSTWFSSRRGLAIGIVTTGNGVGGALYPLIVRELLPKVGFAWTTRVLGFVNLACFTMACALLRPRLPPRKAGSLIDWSAFRDKVYMSFVLGLFCFIMANMYIWYYIASFGMQVLDLPYDSATVLVMIINGAGLPARIIVPMTADRIGFLNVYTCVGFSLALVVFCWLAVSDIAGFYVFTVLCGFISGGFQAMMPSATASITPRLDMVGTRLGMCFTIISLASLTGPPIGGALQSADGGKFTAPQVWSALMMFVAASSLLAARVFKIGWEVKRKS